MSVRKQIQKARNTSLAVVAVLLSSHSTFCAANANSVEVFHYWTTASEASAIAVLEKQAAEAGLNWIDATVAGGAGEKAFASLEARVVAADAPDIGQVKGRDIQKWARLGMLRPLTSIDEQNYWQENLPEEFVNHLKLDGQLYAIPIHIHRSNWLWISKDALNSTNLAPPDSWEDFIDLAQALEQLGTPVVAQSLDTWQLATVFEGLVLASGGSDFYRKAFIELSFREARGEQMALAFKQLRELQKYFIADTAGNAWDQNAISVADGQSSLMFMGDWMKGELLFKDRFVGQDYLCVPTPGQHQGFIYDVNSFASFQNRNEREQNSITLLEQVLSTEFQTQFNIIKGSMPIHEQVNIDAFDDCTRKSMSDFQRAVQENTLVPSIAHGLANINGVQHGLFETLQLFIETPEMTPEQGAKLLAKKMRYGAYFIKN